MYGLTAGEQTYGAEALYWRAIVEAGADLGAPGDLAGLGNPMAQGLAAVSADADPSPIAVAIGTAGIAPELDAATGLSTAVLIESGASLSAAGDGAPAAVMVIGASPALLQSGDAAPAAVAVAMGKAALDADADKASAAVAISSVGATIATAESQVAISAAAAEVVPTYTPAAPELLPLAGSHEADVLEGELKAMLMDLFEKYVRPDERYVNVLGMPQWGPRELIEASLAADGLSIYRGAEVAAGAGAYLLRAWRAHNPKRGLHLLRTYLQLLWPNVWKADQMWQDKSEPYPTALVPEDGGNHFLTSRVHVSLPARVTAGGDLASIQSGLRASLPARMVMEVAIESEESIGIGLANTYFNGIVMQSYEGTIA